MNIRVEPMLYMDPQQAPGRPCSRCGGICYAPGYVCIRCRRDGL